MNIRKRMEMDKVGGPAFPRPSSSAQEHGMYDPQEGMTLRDYFAAKAIQAHVGREDVFTAISQDRLTPKEICDACYEWADAMLKAREAA